MKIIRNIHTGLFWSDCDGWVSDGYSIYPEEDDILPPMEGVVVHHWDANEVCQFTTEDIETVFNLFFSDEEVDDDEILLLANQLRDEPGFQDEMGLCFSRIAFNYIHELRRKQ